MKGRYKYPHSQELAVTVRKVRSLRKKLDVRYEICEPLAKIWTIGKKVRTLRKNADYPQLNKIAQINVVKTL